jgi:hypothetical protein
MVSNYQTFFQLLLLLFCFYHSPISSCQISFHDEADDNTNISVLLNTILKLVSSIDVRLQGVEKSVGKFHEIKTIITSLSSRVVSVEKNISDLFFSQYGFKLSNFFPTFVTSVLFLSQSDFKLSNKFPTPCTLFSTSVIFA